MKLPQFIRNWLTDIAMRMACLVTTLHPSPRSPALAIALRPRFLWGEWYNSSDDGRYQSRHIHTPGWFNYEICETRLLQADGYTYTYYDVASKTVPQVSRVHLGLSKTED